MYKFIIYNTTPPNSKCHLQVGIKVEGNKKLEKLNKEIKY